MFLFKDLSVIVTKYETDIQKLFEQNDVKKQFMAMFEKVQEENERLVLNVIFYAENY